MALSTYFTLILLVSCPFLNSGDIAAQTRKSVSITYTGNMGILISNDKTAVWIDGLHEFYGPDYLNPPDTILEKAFEKKDIFKALQWLLFTHYHRDHYSANLVKRFLKLNPHHKVAGAPQVIDSFSARYIINAWNRNSVILKDTSFSLQVKAFNIPHTWPQRHTKVQNIAYLVELNKIRILHVGDADADPEAFSRVQSESVDVMIVPSWFLENENAKKIIGQLHPKKIIITHIAPGEKLKRSMGIKNADTILFDEISQSISL